MLRKRSRSGFLEAIKKSAKILFVAEAIAFAVTYAGWHRLNTNRDFRYYVKENYPSILESYYQLGEYFSGSRSIRNHDELIWKNLAGQESER